MAKGGSSTTGKPRTKGEMYNSIAESCGLTRRQVSEVFAALGDLIKKDLSAKGPGVCGVAGLMKIQVIKKPAVKARMGRNPFTGEEQMFKAKPARKVVKVRALKALKDMVA